MVIDSHALVWWLEDRSRLSPIAKQHFSSAPLSGSPLFVSAVTLWEMRLKERRQTFLPTTPVSKWPDLLAKIPWIEVVDTDSAIWLAAASLEWAHRDPADRIIAATAITRGVPVLTKDRVFHSEECPVEAVW